MMYNEGIGYLNDSAAAEVDVHFLSIHTVHTLSSGLHGVDPTFWWLVPNNKTKKLATNWLSMSKNAHVSVGINKIGCSGDGQDAKKTAVTCHHSSLIRYNCANSHNIHACMSPFGLRFAYIQIWVMAIYICLARVLASSLAKRTTRIRSIGLGYVWLLILIITIVLSDWTSTAHLLCNALAIRYTSQPSPAIFEHGDVIRAIPGLIGRYERYAYILRDGKTEIRMAGIGVSTVAAFVHTVLFVKRCLTSGVLIRVLTIIVFVYAGCAAVEAISGTIGDVDYVSSKVGRRELTEKEKELRRASGRKFMRVR